MKKKIIIYTTPSCVYCKMAKRLLEKHGVSYEERDVVSDETNRGELVRLSGQMGVPVTVIDGEIVIGFDQDRLQKLLGLGSSI